MRKNLFNIWMEKINILPEFVKQRIYYELQCYLEADNCIKFVSEKKYNFSSYIPLLTYKGRTELEEHNYGYDTNIYNFLSLCKENYSLVEISLNTFLTVEEVSKIFTFCIEQSLIRTPEDIEIAAISDYMAGKLRLGEYFKHNGTLSVDNLEKTIIEYKRLREENPEIKFGQVLTKLGFVNETEINAILRLKEEAKKRLILDVSEFPTTSFEPIDEKEKYEIEIERLKQENQLIKSKLAQLLAMVRKNAQL